MEKSEAAREVFQTLCATLDEMQWTYNKYEPNEEHPSQYYVSTRAIGADLPIDLRIIVDADRRLLYLKSPLPFTFPAGKCLTIMQAVTRINWTMLNGSFELDLSDGYIGFKMLIPFMEGQVSKEMCSYLIVLSCRMVDNVNGKLKAISEGTMSLSELQEFLDKR